MTRRTFSKTKSYIQRVAKIALFLNSRDVLVHRIGVNRRDAEGSKHLATLWDYITRLSGIIFTWNMVRRFVPWPSYQEK